MMLLQLLTTVASIILTMAILDHAAQTGRPAVIARPLDRAWRRICRRDPGA
jgi:hypothetical protein